MFNFKTLTTAAAIVMLSLSAAQTMAADSTSKLLTRPDLVTVEGSIYLVSRHQGRVMFNVNPKISASVPADQAVSQDYLVPGTGIWFTSRDKGNTSFDVHYPANRSQINS